MTNKGAPILFEQGCDPIILEPYRMLRTQIKSLKGLKPLKTILVTSSGPGEGKSTVSSNLGFSLAQAGASVLLIDADLRGPVLGRIFGVESKTGLVDALTTIFSTRVTSGMLGKQGMGDLLQFIKFQERTGCLNVEGNDQVFRLSFERGRMTDAAWVNRPMEKRLGAVLVKQGRMTNDQLEEALQRQTKTDRPLGYLVTRMGYIHSHDLEPILRAHFSESLNEVFELKEASYAFQEIPAPKAKRGRLNGLDVDGILSNEANALAGLDQPLIEERLNSFIKETKIKNLSIMTSGSETSHASELLNSDRLKALVKTLSTRFDYIVFDSPPVGLNADASVLGSLLDGVILVVQSGRFGVRTVQQAKEELSKVKANILGVVLNKLDIKKESYYGYYYQYYNQYYTKKTQ